MPKAVRFIFAVLIIAAIGVAAWYVGVGVGLLFEGSTIRVWFIPLGNGTGGGIARWVVTIIGVIIAISAGTSFYKKS
jgi:hypothetical protein